MNPTTDKQVEIIRTFNAPREVVFKAFSNIGQLEKWYAPPGCTIKFSKLDFRQGGKYLSVIVIPNGKECWCVGEYLEIKAPEKIVFTMAISDANGNLLTATEAEMDPDWPQQTTVTLTFEEEAGKTKLTLYQTVSEELAKRTGAYPSWLMMFDRLANEVL